VKNDSSGIKSYIFRILSILGKRQYEGYMRAQRGEYEMYINHLWILYEMYMDVYESLMDFI
jgi:hypothetical protein